MRDPQQSPPPDAARAATWRRYLRFWGPRADADVDDELGFHFDMRVRDYMAHGMSEADAHRAVLERLGNLAAARAECVAITSRRERRMTRAQLVDVLVHDVRFACRTLLRQKGWTAVAVITLALGIGANTAVFGVVNTLILHPLPYPGADRMAIIYQEPTRGNSTGMQVLVNPNADVVRAWREGATSFEAIEAYSSGDRALRTLDGTPAVIQSASVLPSFPAFAGQHPLLGRVFSDAEIGDARVAMISESFWRARYGADLGVIGKSITLDRVPYTVVGVMPAAFRLPRLTATVTDVWLPLDLRDRDILGLSVIGRLRHGATLAAAARELDALDPGVNPANAKQRDFAVKLASPSEMVRFRASLVLLSAAVALVLLIACGNVTHLMLARTATRQRELAIRSALGASRSRLVRQLLTESLILAAVGCMGGLLVGWLGLHAIVALRPDNLSELASARIDRATLLVTAALATGTGLVVGLLGAMQTRRHSAHDALKAGALSVSQSRRQRRLRSLLVVSEMAVSTVLLVGAMLLVRSMLHLQRLDPGFDATGLYSVKVDLLRASYPTSAARASFMTRAVERVGAVAGVGAVTVAAGAPPSRSFLLGALQVQGEPEPPKGTTAFIDYNGIEPDFFRTMGMRLVEGTTITDTSKAAAQVVVNVGFAKKYWPGQSALGRRVRVVFNGDGDWLTIVGVAADAFTGGLTAEAGAPTLYVSGARIEGVLIVRALPGSDPLPTIRALVAQLDPALPPATVTNIEDAMARTIAGPRFTMTLLVAFTALALVLAAVGLYGVMAYGVAQRTREIGIRIALGATRRDVARSVVSHGVLLALVGAALGAIGARAGSALLEDMLYGVARTDAVSFASGVLLLVTTAVVACIVPTRRAMAVDPLIAIKAD